jgi:hypothetical protein
MPNIPSYPTVYHMFWLYCKKKALELFLSSTPCFFIYINYRLLYLSPKSPIVKQSELLIEVDVFIIIITPTSLLLGSGQGITLHGGPKRK